MSIVNVPLLEDISEIKTGSFSSAYSAIGAGCDYSKSEWFSHRVDPSFHFQQVSHLTENHLIAGILFGQTYDLSALILCWIFCNA